MSTQKKDEMDLKNCIDDIYYEIDRNKKIRKYKDFIITYIENHETDLKNFCNTFSDDDLDKLLNDYEYKYVITDIQECIKKVAIKYYMLHVEKQLHKFIWNCSPEDYPQFLHLIKAYAFCLKVSNLSTSQIRNVFGEIKKIVENENDEENKILMLQKLRPKLAYTVGRFPQNYGIKSFLTLLDDLITKLDNEHSTNALFEFVESVLCYLKFYGDKN